MIRITNTALTETINWKQFEKLLDPSVCAFILLPFFSFLFCLPLYSVWRARSWKMFSSVFCSLTLLKIGKKFINVKSNWWVSGARRLSSTSSTSGNEQDVDTYYYCNTVGRFNRFTLLLSFAKCKKFSQASEFSFPHKQIKLSVWGFNYVGIPF